MGFLLAGRGVSVGWSWSFCWLVMEFLLAGRGVSVGWSWSFCWLVMEFLLAGHGVSVGCSRFLWLFTELIYYVVVIVLL
jgi:hypothetical protein